MTDTTTPATPVQHPQHNIKSILLSTFCGQYNSLLNTVNLLPIDPVLKTLITFSFGSAFTYAKEHICALPDGSPIPLAPVAPEAPKDSIAVGEPCSPEARKDAKPSE